MQNLPPPFDSDERTAGLVRRLTRRGLTENKIYDVILLSTDLPRQWDTLQTRNRAAARLQLAETLERLAIQFEADPSLYNITVLNQTVFNESLARTLDWGDAAENGFESTCFPLDEKAPWDDSTGPTRHLVRIAADSGVESLPVPRIYEFFFGLAAALGSPFWPNAFERYTAEDAPRKAKGKTAKRTFCMKTCFRLLNETLGRPRQAPNIEVALLTNILLGLEGDESAKPRDVTQARKDERRRYTIE